jgi:hypothetical protein
MKSVMYVAWTIRDCERIVAQKCARNIISERTPVLLFYDVIK